MNAPAWEKNPVDQRGPLVILALRSGSMVFLEERLMRVTVEGPAGLVLQTGGENVLAPLEESERAAAYSALVDALAVLAGVTLSTSSAAMEDGSDAPRATTARYRADHKYENVFHLGAPRGTPGD